jgi:hypothetical protein
MIFTTCRTGPRDGMEARGDKEPADDVAADAYVISSKAAREAGGWPSPAISWYINPALAGKGLDEPKLSGSLATIHCDALGVALARSVSSTHRCLADPFSECRF